MFRCLCRMFWGMMGFRWLTRPGATDKGDDAETERWRQRRRRFRSRVRSALAEMLTDEQPGE